MKTPVTALQFSQSNSLKDILAFGGGDGTVSLLKMANGALTVIVSVADIYSHTSNVNALKWNRDHLASCGDDGSVRVYRVWPE